MPPLRAPNVPHGRVWINGYPYKPGQFIPADTKFYDVEYFYDPNAAELSAGAVGRQQAVVRMAVSATVKTIMEEIDELRQARLDNRLWANTPTPISSLGQADLEDEDEEEEEE